MKNNYSTFTDLFNSIVELDLTHKNIPGEVARYLYVKRSKTKQKNTKPNYFEILNASSNESIRQYAHQVYLKVESKYNFENRRHTFDYNLTLTAKKILLQNTK